MDWALLDYNELFFLSVVENVRDAIGFVVCWVLREARAHALDSWLGYVLRCDLLLILRLVRVGDRDLIGVFDDG